MAPQIVLLMPFPVFRCNVSTNWLWKLPRPRTPSVHGRSNSWRTPQPLPKTRGCYINTADIPSWNQSTPSVLWSIYYPTLPSFTTYPMLFLLLYGSPGFLQTIKVYPAGIHLEHQERGFEDPTKDELLQLLCTGIQRSQGAQTCTRLPITITVLQTLKSQLRIDSAFSLLEKRLLWAAFTMAFYGFLRASEFATPSLEWQHVQRTDNAYTIFIEQSKTDPFRCGHSITIYASSTSTCPVKALHLYAEVVPQHQGNAPIFKGGRFSPLTASNSHIQYVIFSRAHHITNSITPATVFEVVQQPLLLQHACQIGSLKPLADGTAMLTRCTYSHPQRC